jgi:hypothetical protein
MVWFAAALVGFHFHAPWEPKTNLLPPNFVKAAQFLLDHGLEDPRGCELRSAQYDLHVPIMNRGYAWVRPGQPTQLRNVINPSGIKVDAREVRGSVSFSNLLPRLQPESESGFPSHVWFEKGNALELVMLAIHGEEKLVRQQMDLLVKSHSGSPDQIPFQALQAFKSALYNISLDAFRRGDDEKALWLINQWQSDMQEFEKIVPLVWSSPYYNYGEEGKSVRSYFRISGETQGIQSELVTRVANKYRKPISMQDIDRMTISDQVPVLIEKLAESGDAGESEVDVGSSPMYRRLKEIRQRAVPALLVALRENNRITRLQPMTNYGRSLDSPIQFISVKSIVRQILAELAYQPSSRSDKQLEAYWNANLGKEDSVRVYEALRVALSSETPDSYVWYEPCRALLMDEKQANQTYIIGYSEQLMPGKISIRPEMAPLLDYRNLTVSTLLLNGIRSKSSSAEEALGLAQVAFHWRPNESLPALELACRKYLDSVLHPDPNRRAASEEHFAFILEARKSLGDSTTVDDENELATTIMTQPKNGHEYDAPGRYFLNHLGDPRVASLARKIFLNPTSTYNLSKSFKDNPFNIGAIASPIFTLPEGKSLANDMLNNREPFTEEQFQKFGYGEFKIDPTGRRIRVSGDSLRPCDLAARAFWYIKGCPEFQMKWPVNHRDRAIPNIRRFVNSLQLKDLKYKYSWRFGVVY